MDVLRLHLFLNSQYLSLLYPELLLMQVYQASTTTHHAPGGLREVHRSVSDTRSGVRKMAVGRHLGERGHVIEKEQNYHTGDVEEREDFINLDEG